MLGETGRTYVYNFSSRTMSGGDAIAEIIQAIKRAAEAPRMRAMETKCGKGRVFADCGFADYALDEYEWAQYRGKPIMVDDPPWALGDWDATEDAPSCFRCFLRGHSECVPDPLRGIDCDCGEVQAAHAMAVLLDRQLEQNAQADK